MPDRLDRRSTAIYIFYKCPHGFLPKFPVQIYRDQRIHIIHLSDQADLPTIRNIGERLVGLRQLSFSKPLFIYDHHFWKIRVILPVAVCLRHQQAVFEFPAK